MTSSDIFIIGGGINGTAIAADAAGRGLSVTLCERYDLASGTSSASTKLIHGGLRYLEFYEFNLVRKALHEREILFHKAPHLITPLKFILPYENHLRPAWMIRLGLFLYDHLSSRKSIPGSKSLVFNQDSSLLPEFKKGFSYYDCFTDDARLVVLNALAAKENNARIFLHSEFISAQRENNLWQIELKDSSGNIIHHQAKVLINTAGPWINQIQERMSAPQFEIELVKGSHIVVPKLFSENNAYILQNKDERIVFAIPYEDDFTLIGTTDVALPHELTSAITLITPDEINYLCSTINHYFKKSISPADIVWSYSGVRCLQGDNSPNPAKKTRDYKLEWQIENELPLLTVIGGKLTTNRYLAEDVVNHLKPYFPTMKPAWTASSPLPGGDMASFENFYEQFRQQYAWLPEKLAYRYAKSYGTRVHMLLQNTLSLKDLGMAFSADLYQKEIEYLIQHEWANSIDDILWRRSKLGLVLSVDEVDKLDKWLANQISLY